MENVLKVAVQKNGRLSEKSLELIRNCGIDFNSGSSLLKSPALNFPLEFLYLRDDDIPGYVADGVADIGIVGLNVADEKGQQVELVQELGFSRCRLSLAVPNSFNYSSISDLAGKTIATSYPKILGEYLASNNVQAQIHEISGSVEISPLIGLSDAICDIVSTGSTLLSNGLKEVEAIYQSQAVMISYPKLTEAKKEILNRLLLRINSVRRAAKYKYILLNVPDSSLQQVCQILPGMKSPTITPLATQGWSSVQSVVKEDEFWEIIERLNSAGAEGILVLPIEKMIF